MIMTNKNNRVATKKELSLMYGVHYNTFMKWIKDIPDLRLTPHQRILTPRQVALIFDELNERE